MTNIAKVVQKTLETLEKKALKATPRAYEKEFKAIADKLNYTLPHDITLIKLYNELTEDEKVLFNKDKSKNYETMINILFKRASLDKINKISTLLMKAIKPSVSNTLDSSIEKIGDKINKLPALLFQNDIQMELTKLIENKIQIDQNILIDKAKDVDDLMSLLNSHINSAVNTNSGGVSDIQKISLKLNNMDISSLKHIENIHKELTNTTKSIESQMIKTNEKLEDGKNDIESLQSRIKELETELNSTKKENEIDHLTSLYTRKAFEEHMKEIEYNYDRTHKDYAIVFFDIDHFKNVNDTYGHDGGDVILSTFAKLLLRSTRDTDIMGRYGGEEFIGILHFKKEQELEQYISRIKTIVTTNRFKYNEHKIPITFSAGLTYRSKNESYDKALLLADELLYKAKNSGRNKIIFQNGTEI
jgi:diguanylate cyclase (GGDEF)-like protein